VRELLRRGDTCFAVAEGRSGVIIDADDYYRNIADAIESARSYVLIAGWQLESSVLLRRLPEDEGRARTLREVVRSACEHNRELRIYVLAWDWASIYAFDREWRTREKLKKAGLGQLEFRYDATHPQGASHHDKLVVVDGHTAWVGGIDICEHRWDRRSHIDSHPLRLDGDGSIYLPYHDVQAVVRGPVVHDLVEHFVERWANAHGEDLVLVPEPEPDEAPRCHIDLGRTLTGVSRTRGAMVVPLTEPVREIRHLFTEALSSAERLVYIESQYVTSRAMTHALIERFKDRSRPTLEVVIFMPARLEGRMEKATIAPPQYLVLSALTQTAKEHGHSFGVFAPLAPIQTRTNTQTREITCPTYVHSKLMIVDDRFLTIGSANATNRSMGLDSELNLAWDCAMDNGELERGIRALRVSLLTEHVRLSAEQAMTEHFEPKGLCEKLRAWTRRETPPLMELCFDGTSEQNLIDDLLASLGDPERASLAEGVFEEVVDRPEGFLAKVLTALEDVAGSRA
jgi:phosphatidylserine/phosphatidylglycerophosphate/cardiolipin synthase-like enzyme